MQGARFSGRLLLLHPTLPCPDPPPGLRFSPLSPFSRIVITLARQIGETAHCSLLQRKARRHGLADLTSIMRLAVARGARHYASVYPPAERDPGVEAISHEELVALLLLGAQPFEPFALRCAAQIISLCDLHRLSLIARRERISRPLAHIAHAGAAHDSEQTARWQELLRLLGSPPRFPPAACRTGAGLFPTAALPAPAPLAPTGCMPARE